MEQGSKKGINRKWSNWQEELIISMVQDGKGYEDIRRALNQTTDREVTRNMVAGLVHKMRREKRIPPVEKRVKKPKIVRPAALVPPTTPSRPAGPAEAVESLFERVATEPVVESKVYEGDHLTKGVVLPEEKQCKYPFGHPGREGFHFCAAGRIGGEPYCAEHMKLCRSKYVQLSMAEVFKKRDAERAKVGMKAVGRSEWA